MTLRKYGDGFADSLVLIEPRDFQEDDGGGIRAGNSDLVVEFTRTDGRSWLRKRRP